MRTFRFFLNIRILILFFLMPLFVPVYSQQEEALTLDRALEIAETSSPALQTSMLNLQRSQKNLEAQRAALRSNVSLTVNPVNYSNSRQFDTRTSQWYTNEALSTNGTLRIDQPILWTDGTISLVNKFGWQYSKSDFGNASENRAYTNNLYLSIQQPLFTYNRLQMNLKQLELSLENSKISFALQRLNLERNVTQYFYNVYMAQMNLDIAKEDLANTQNSYDIMKNKVDAGLSAMEELYQAELNLSTSKSSLQNAGVSYENAKDQLKMYLGMDLFTDIAIMAEPEADTVNVDLDKAIEHGLNSRMEIRQREIDVENGQFSLIQTKALNEFSGNLNLSVGLTSDNENLDAIFDNTTRSPSVGVSLNIPLFDWGEKKARIEAQEATMQTQQISLSEQKKQIIIDIRQAYRNLQNQAIQIDIAKQSEANAQLTYEINLQRYENGDLTGMDLNLYQTQLSQKKISSAQALINYKIQLLNLKIQSLYDWEKNVEVVPSDLYNTSIE